VTAFSDAHGGEFGAQHGTREQSITVLERNAVRAPPQAPKGLERAARGSRVGLARPSRTAKARQRSDPTADGFLPARGRSHDASDAPKRRFPAESELVSGFVGLTDQLIDSIIASMARRSGTGRVGHAAIIMESSGDGSFWLSVHLLVHPAGVNVPKS
jgi:hypothetical protein